MAALCTMGNKDGLIEKICVARDETVGIYGFVFYRGKWNPYDISESAQLTECARRRMAAMHRG